MNFSAGLSLLTDLVLENLGSVFGCHADSSIQIWDTKFQQPGYHDFSVATFSNYFLTHTLGWETFRWNFSSWNGVNVQRIHPDSNITEKNLMWLAGLRKNMKSSQIKGSLNSSCLKNNPGFRNWRNYWYWLLQQRFILKDSLGVVVTGVY